MSTILEPETLMLDSSSTAFYVARSLNMQNKKVTIITNSLKIVSELQDSKNIKCIITGGIFNNSRKSIVGKWTEVLINNYYVNKAIVCCKGIDLKRGVTDSNEEEAAIKIAMCKSASEVWLLVDSNKFDKASFVKIMDFDMVNKVYTDKIISTQWKEILEHNMIETIIC
ncbi:MAG: DeoR/GlpR family DNA-binding transcription regulator [Sarcina sp.]